MTVLTDRGEAALIARPLPGLSQLIHPVEVEAFARDYWEREPLLIQRGRPDYYADLLSLDDLDQVLARSAVSLDRVRVVVDGKETPVAELRFAQGMQSLEALYERYRTGSTIVLNALDQTWEPLRRLSHVLGSQLSARIQSNIYLTPPGNQGFAPHYDSHDVFVAQVHGTKHWRLARQPYDLPLADRPYDKTQPWPEPEQEFDLSCGDILYLPRGTVHWATANQTASAHVTIGLHPMLYAQLIERAVKGLYGEDVDFRKALPIGFASSEDGRRLAADMLAKLLARVGEVLSPSELIGQAAKRATSLGLPALRHHLTDLEQLDGIGLTTPVRRRPELRWRMTVTPQVVNIDFHGKTVHLPAVVAEEVRFLADGEGDGDGEVVSGAAIPGDLGDEGRLLLVTTLVREGFLTLV